MKAITLWQPWATFIAARLKSIETRTHRNFFCLLHQRIAIHAGRSWDEDAEEWALSVCRPSMREEVSRAVRRARGQLGAVVCTAVVKDTRIIGGPPDEEAALTQIEENRYGLVLSEIRAFPEPVRVSGRQGIWEWDEQSAEKASPAAGGQMSLLV